MNRKCTACQFVNFATETQCQRCGARLNRAPRRSVRTEDDFGKKLDANAIWFIKRFLTALLVSFALLLIAYLSMLYSAEPLTAEQTATVEAAIKTLEKQGFKREAWFLRHSSYRSNDNWFNTLMGHNDAYAATNFPFQIVTLYPDFFKVPVDDVERAAVLLHEAQHLQGSGEPSAYEAVWRSRKRLNWTRAKYEKTEVYHNVLRSTKQFAPELFICGGSYENDCTE